MGKFATESTLIIKFDPDRVIEDHVSGLLAKANKRGSGVRVVTFRSRGGDSSWWERAELLAKCRLLPDRYRLFLHGHGSWKNQTIGGWTADHVAALLNGVYLPAPTVVSVGGCSLGRDIGSAGYGQVGHSIDSFGSKLHRLMKTVCGHEVDLFARVYDVGITKAGNSPMAGHKGVFLSETLPGITRKKSHSKLHFYWNGDQQARKWADDDGDVTV
jgi:hypothetical protein